MKNVLFVLPFIVATVSPSVPGMCVYTGKNKECVVVKTQPNVGPSQNGRIDKTP